MRYLYAFLSIYLIACANSSGFFGTGGGTGAVVITGDVSPEKVTQLERLATQIRHLQGIGTKIDSLSADIIGLGGDVMEFVNDTAGTMTMSGNFDSEAWAELNRAQREYARLQDWDLGLEGDLTFTERVAPNTNPTTESILNKKDEIYQRMDEQLAEHSEEMLNHAEGVEEATREARDTINASGSTNDILATNTILAGRQTAILRDMYRLAIDQYRSENNEKAVELTEDAKTRSQEGSARAEVIKSRIVQDERKARAQEALAEINRRVMVDTGIPQIQ